MLNSVQHRHSHSVAMSLLCKVSATGVHYRVLNIIVIELLVVRFLKLSALQFLLISYSNSCIHIQATQCMTPLESLLQMNSSFLKRDKRQSKEISL